MNILFDVLLDGSYVGFNSVHLLNFLTDNECVMLCL